MSKPHITALDIEKKEFSVSLRGYNQSEVRAYLERVSAQVEVLEGEIRGLRDRLAQAEADRKRLMEMEDNVKQTLLLAQSAADQAKLAARMESQTILREAETERLRVIADIEHLRAERDAFLAQLRSMIEAFYARLSSEAVVEIGEVKGATGT